MPSVKASWYVPRVWSWFRRFFFSSSKCRRVGKGRVWVIVGTLGAGKTSLAVLMAHKARPSPIWFNNWMKLPRREIRLIKNLKEASLAKHGVCIIDDLGISDNSHNWASTPEEYTAFCIQARKRHVLVLGTCQEVRQVDVAVGNNVEYYLFPRLIAIPLLGWLFPPSYRPMYECEEGAVVSWGNALGFGTAWVVDFVTKDNVQLYLTQRDMGMSDAHMQKSVFHSRIYFWRNWLADCYNSHFEVAAMFEGNFKREKKAN